MNRHHIAPLRSRCHGIPPVVSGEIAGSSPAVPHEPPTDTSSNSLHHYRSSSPSPPTSSTRNLSGAVGPSTVTSSHFPRAYNMPQPPPRAVSGIEHAAGSMKKNKNSVTLLGISLPILIAGRRFLGLRKRRQFWPLPRTPSVFVSGSQAAGSA